MSEQAGVALRLYEAPCIANIPLVGRIDQWARENGTTLSHLLSMWDEGRDLSPLGEIAAWIANRHPMQLAGAEVRRVLLAYNEGAEDTWRFPVDVADLVACFVGDRRRQLHPTSGGKQ